MNLNAVGIVYRKEFTEWVRDRRTLISTVLVPLFLFPLMMVGFSALAVVMVGKAEKETPKIMILGGEHQEAG
jgi:sodium transport system permease protein